MDARGWLGGFLCLALAGSARAAGPDEEREGLVRQLAQDYAALSTSDCVTACRALGSMQRAADRICEVSPGATCSDARAKVEDARRRVREACPACVADAPRFAPPPAPDSAPVAATQAAPAPPAEQRRGGCAGCTTSGATGGEGGGAALLVALTAFARRRPRRVREPRAPSRARG